MVLRIRRNLGEMVYSPDFGSLAPGQAVPNGVSVSASLTEDAAEDILWPPGTSGSAADIQYAIKHLENRLGEGFRRVSGPGPGARGRAK